MVVNVTEININNDNNNNNNNRPTDTRYYVLQTHNGNVLYRTMISPAEGHNKFFRPSLMGVTNTPTFKDVQIWHAFRITLLNFNKALPFLPVKLHPPPFTTTTHDTRTCFHLVCKLLDARLCTAFLQIDSIHPFQFHP